MFICCTTIKLTFSSETLRKHRTPSLAARTMRQSWLIDSCSCWCESSLNRQNWWDFPVQSRQSPSFRSPSLNTPNTHFETSHWKTGSVRRVSPDERRKSARQPSFVVILVDDKKFCLKISYQHLHTQRRNRFFSEIFFLFTVLHSPWAEYHKVDPSCESLRGSSAPQQRDSPHGRRWSRPRPSCWDLIVQLMHLKLKILTNWEPIVNMLSGFCGPAHFCKQNYKIWIFRDRWDLFCSTTIVLNYDITTITSYWLPHVHPMIIILLASNTHVLRLRDFFSLRLSVCFCLRSGKEVWKQNFNC